MKKLALIAFAAMMILTACTKEKTPTLDGTSWYCSKTDSGGRKQTCSISFRNNGGGLGITDSYSSWQTSWDYKYEYTIKSYTFDGESGIINLQQANSYTRDGTATFRVNDIQSILYISTPNGSFTLDRR